MNTHRHSRIAKMLFVIPVLLITSISCTQVSDTNMADLEEGFRNPPSSARARVWWHWMNGNITQEGIRADLAWMKRVGIGGFQNFDAAFMTPQVVENRLVYMTPEWQDAFRMTTQLADSLGLEMAIAGSPGWSESGGPWVTPAEGMKKMVWSELTIEGGKAFSGQLPHPPTSTGTFQNLTSQSETSMLSGGEVKAKTEYYADAAVIAYKIPEADRSLRELNPKVTSSGGTFTLEQLTDGDLLTTVLLPAAKEGEWSWIKFEFDQPQTIQSISMVGGGNVGRFGIRENNEKRMLESSVDGKNFQPVIEITSGGINQNTITFPAVTAKYFRVAIETPSAPVASMASLMLGMAEESRRPVGTNIAEIVLYTTPRIQEFERKAGFAYVTDVETILTPATQAENTINEADVIDLTALMKSDGSLDWTPPAGRWNVIRMGYSLTGHENGPASSEATGLEVDKLNATHVRSYFANYLDQYKNATGGLMGERGLQYMVTDSYEAGAANWTDQMIEEFNRRNSYSMLPWLPVLTGKIVKSSEASEKFLWDFRNMLEGMIAEYHYDELSSILKERGMKRYSESHEDQRAMLADGMEVKKNADIPMSATWVPDGRGPVGPNGPKVQTRFEADVRESASVAHIYGQNIAAAESFTAIMNSYAFDPARLKSTADIMLSNGLNRFVIHTSVHQPLDNNAPGLGLGPFGQWFTRHETWGEQAKPWMDYLARSSYMLQQGKFVADIIYVYGQGSNLTWLFRDQMPAIPAGYNYDFLNAGAVPGVLSVKNGSLQTASGMTYKLLVLDESTRYMTLPVLKKLQELVTNGAVVTGARPTNTPSLNDDEGQFKAIADQLWSSAKGVQKTGKGKVYTDYSLEETLKDMHLKADVEFLQTTPDSEIRFVHRSLGKQQIYWISTNNPQPSIAKLSFAVDEMKPEIWDPVSGEIRPASYMMINGRTEVTLDMAPEDALFVVFASKTGEKSQDIPKAVEAEQEVLSGEWQVAFQSGRGAPATTVFNVLTPWNEHTEDGIKYFSGTATYTQSIHIPTEWINDNKDIWIDLGEVKNLAEVSANGKPVGIVWKAPFKINIGKAVQAGDQELSIKVTNLWVNRLIGDAQPGVKEKFTYTTMPFYQANSPLLRSGLMGPVKLIRFRD